MFIAILTKLAGCAEEMMEEIPVPVIPDGYIRAALDLQVEENELIQTRADATDEQAYDDSNVWVLLFKTNNVGIPIELLQAPAKATKSENKLYVLLRSTPDPVTLYVVAGLSADLNTAMASLSEGDDFATVNTALQTAPITPTGVLIGGSSYFHLSSEPAFYEYGTTSIVSITLPLIRNAAKINVDASAISSDDFLLEGVTLVNGAKKGYVLQQVAISANYDSNIQQYEEKIPGDENKLTSQIYLYENAGLRSDGTTPNPTTLILRGKYKRAGGSSYYRIDLLKRNTNGTYTPYDIERNHCYTLTITKIENAGYLSYDQAIANEPSNKWFQTDVVVTDTYAHDVVSNGRYYLGVSNSEYFVYSNPSYSTSQLIVTVTTNAPRNTVTSITFSSNITTVSPTSLTTPTGGVTTTNISANLSGVVTDGWIDVRVGNLTRRITIRKREGVDHNLVNGVIGDFATGNYIAGKVMSNGSNTVHLGTSGSDYNSSYGSTATSSLVNPNGGFYIYYNSWGRGSGTRLGEVYLSKANNEGRAKIVLVVK